MDMGEVRRVPKEAGADRNLVLKEVEMCHGGNNHLFEREQWSRLRREYQRSLKLAEVEREKIIKWLNSKIDSYGVPRTPAESEAQWAYICARDFIIGQREIVEQSTPET
jgi:hypothetical protein